MKFRGNETFYIRSGWLTKGLRKISEKPCFFTAKDGEQTMELGVGANMVKAIRYYLSATGLATEERGKGFSLTEFGRLVIKHDLYMQRTGTLLLLHYFLAVNKENATAWYFFFNEYTSTEVSRQTFFQQITDFIKQNGGNEIAGRSLEDDFSSILKTYQKRTDEALSFEDNLECPLAELRLLQKVTAIEGVSAKKIPFEVQNLPPEIALFIIKKSCDENQSEIKISSIEKGKCSLGKILNLSVVDVAEILERLERERFVKVTRSAGIETVRFLEKAKKSAQEYMNDYYTKQEADE